MNKTDLLFQMMEQPQAYTDQQWQEILSDEECRELYTLMSKTQSAFDAQKEIDDEIIDDEWKRLTPSSNRNWLRVAAMYIGVLLISGIAFATVQLMRSHGNKPAEVEPQPQVVKTRVSDVHKQPADTAVTIPPVVFDNVTLDSILPQIAQHYGYTVSFRSDKSKPLRLFLKWNPQDSIQKVTEKLNLFEQIHIVLDEQTMIVE
jgi:hypothetical protein